MSNNHTSRWGALDDLTHPAVAIALTVLLINDHILKKATPSWVTGKLSDFAGLVVFPLVLAGAISVLSPRRIERRLVIAWSLVATAVAFSAVQLTETGVLSYRYVWGAMQYPLRLLMDPGVDFRPVEHTPDPSDLWALAALVVPWRIASRGRLSGNHRGDGAVGEG